MKMHTPGSLFDFRSLLGMRSAIVPIAGGAFAGMAFALFRAPATSEAESIMNFSKLGTLRCICGAEHSPEGHSDRRQFCRSCGCEVVEQNMALLDKPMSREEIRTMTRTLRRAAIRARNLELPASITSVEELHNYLAGSGPKDRKTPPNQPPSLKVPQVH